MLILSGLILSVGGELEYRADNIHLNHLAQLLTENFCVISPQNYGETSKFEIINKFSQVSWFSKRSVFSFKRFLFPNNTKIEIDHQKIAFTGLPLCDIAALNIFIKQFKTSGLLPNRDDILIIGGECQPDDNCFCDQFSFKGLLDYDLYIFKQNSDFIVKTNSWRGEQLIKKIGLKKIPNTTNLKSKIKTEKIELDLTQKNIDNKEMTFDYWQKIANNCFGCGACSAVCPLCFCFDQDFETDLDGEHHRRINWTSCFSPDFSQIQNGFDLRPSNRDRIYNWYHHKFVRGPKELGYALCVGCGRCITACPAHLNIKNIINSMNHKYGSENKK